VTLDNLRERIATCRFEGQIMLTVQMQDILLNFSECVNHISEIGRVEMFDALPPSGRAFKVEQSRN
jgi:hypothetical protein